MGPITTRAERFVRNVFKTPEAAAPTPDSKPKAKVDWKLIAKQRAKVQNARRGY